MHRHLAVAGVEPDRHAAGKFLGRVDHQRRIAHRRGADDDAVDALGQPAFHRRHVAHAAAELHRYADGFENAIDSAGIHRLAGKSAVEIDDVQIFKSRQFKSARLRRRIAVKHGGARHVALLEAHGQSLFEIDGGKKNHGAHFRKFAISLSPNRWLFSGWNCVPTMLSRPTMAVSGPP